MHICEEAVKRLKTVGVTGTRTGHFRETASRYTSFSVTISSCAVPAHCWLPPYHNLRLTRHACTQAPLLFSYSLWFLSFAVLTLYFPSGGAGFCAEELIVSPASDGSQINLPRTCACQPEEIGRPELPVAVFRKKRNSSSLGREGLCVEPLPLPACQLLIC